MAALILLENWKRGLFVVQMGRVWCMLVIGTWTVHTSFVLYIPWGKSVKAFDCSTVGWGLFDYELQNVVGLQTTESVLTVDCRLWTVNFGLSTLTVDFELNSDYSED